MAKQNVTVKKTDSFQGWTSSLCISVLLIDGVISFLLKAKGFQGTLVSPPGKRGLGGGGGGPSSKHHPLFDSFSFKIINKVQLFIDRNHHHHRPITDTCI